MMHRGMIHRDWKWALICACLAFSSYALEAQTGAPDGPPQGPPPGESQAGPQHGPGGRMGGRMDAEHEVRMLTRLLTLTADQQTGVKAVLVQQRTQMEALRGQTTPAAGAATADTRQARMAQAKQIREETSTKIAALLDDSQKKLYADWEQNRKAEMEKRLQRDGGDDRGNGGDQPPPPPAEEK